MNETVSQLDAIPGQAAAINIPEQFIEALREGNQITAAGEEVARAINVSEGVLALPEDVTVRDLEAYLPQRRRMRGTFSTAYVEHFVQYAGTMAAPGAVVFVDAPEMAATAVLDLGDNEAPGHCDHRAKLALRKTAAFDALSQIEGRAQGQQKLAEWLEDWAAHAKVECFAGSETLPLGRVVAAVRTITIEALRKVNSEEQQLSANRTAFESVAASSKETLPTHIYYSCRPYPDLAERLFVLRLSVITSDKPTLVLRVASMEQHTEAMGQELAELVRTAMREQPEALPVLLGNFSKAT